MSMMQKLKSCKIMMKSKNGLKKQRKFHYLLGLTEEQRKLNTQSLKEWLQKNDNDYQDGIRTYSRQIARK